MELAFFFPHVSRAQRLAPARTRTQVVRLGAQCTDHWTAEQSRGGGLLLNKPLTKRPEHLLFRVHFEVNKCVCRQMEGSLISDPLLGVYPLAPNSDKRLNQTLRS